MKKKALVISGGGSKGAFANAVESVQKENYDLFAASSSGALAQLMIAQGKQDEAVEFHRNVVNSTIYDKDPYNKNYKLKKGKIVFDFISGKPSLATTNKLLKIIRNNYSVKAHRELKKTKEIIVVVTNMNTREPIYISNKDCTWSQFTFWTWVSTLAYPFSNTVVVDGVEYGDGGFSVSLPVGYACKRCDNVRAIILNEEKENVPFDNENIFQGVISVIDVIMSTSLKKDIGYGLHFVKYHNVNLQYIFMLNKITDHPMRFIPEEANEMIYLGKEAGKKNKI